MQLQAILDRCRLALFLGLCLLLCVPFVARVFRWGAPPESAMQALAPMPKWAELSMPRYFASLEQWVNHHYPLRLELIRAHGYLKHRWLKAPSPLVLVGSDVWLFYLGNRTGEDLVGRDRFSEADLQLWVKTMLARRAWLRQHGIRHLLVFAPNKSTIYPEKIPLLMRQQIRPGKLDQLVAALTQAGLGSELVDLRPRLFEEKKQHICYWPTDSHWNAEGLLASCDEIMLRLKAMGIGEAHPSYATLFRVEHLPRDGDCVSLLGMMGSWPTHEVSQVRVLSAHDYRRVDTQLSKIPMLSNAPPWALPFAFEHDSGKGRAVLLSDSFFRVGGLAPESFGQPPLSLHFKRFVSVWNWNDTRNLADFSVLSAISEMEHPDVLIEQITERYLRTQPIDHPEYQKALLK